MMKKRIAISAVAVILGAAIVFFLFDSTDNEKQLNESEAIAKVTELYGGEAIGSTIAEDTIIIELQTAQGIYKAAVDRISGQVASLKLVEKIGKPKDVSEQQAEEIALQEVQGEVEEISYSVQQNEYRVRVTGETEVSVVSVSAETGKIIDVSTEAAGEKDPLPTEPETTPEPQPVISREEAVSLAMKTLNGELQEVEFTDTPDGGYYLVEIENEETEKEVTVQIHAIRGETLTVDWDD